MEILPSDNIPYQIINSLEEDQYIVPKIPAYYILLLECNMDLQYRGVELYYLM